MEDRKTECGRCGRGLKSEKSKRDGFGPVCLKKHEAEIVKAQAKADGKKD